MSMTTPYGGLEDVASLQQKDLNVGTSLLNNSIGQYMQSAAIPVNQPGWGMQGFQNLQAQSPMGAVQMGQPAPTKTPTLQDILSLQNGYMGA